MTEDEKRVLIFRHFHNKENPYVVISKEGLEDTRLSWKARGILSYLLGKPDTWKVVMEHLKKEAPDGARSLRSGLLELQFFGYLEKFVEKDKGRFKQFGYNIYEVSQKPDATIDEYNKIKENKKEKEKKRKTSYNHPFLRFAQMENSTLVSNDIVYNELNTPEGENMQKIDPTTKDGFLAMLQMSNPTGMSEYAESVSHFPETMQKPMIKFLEKFQLPKAMIPNRKNVSGKGRWIKGMKILLEISESENTYYIALDKAYEKWYNDKETNLQVNAPDKIQNLLGAEVQKLKILAIQRKEEKAKEKTEEKKDFVNAEDGAKLLKQLQKSLKKGKEE